MVAVENEDGVINKCFETLGLNDFNVTDQIIQLDSCNLLQSFKGFLLDPNVKVENDVLFILSFYESCEEFSSLVSFIESNSIGERFSVLVFSKDYLKVNGNNFYYVHVPADNYIQFQRKVARHLELMVKQQPLGSPMNPLSLKFTDHVIEANVVDETCIIYDKKYVLSINLNGVPYEMHCNFVSGSKKLIVLGQDALTRDKVELPHFFRWKWVDDLPCSTIILNDPTLYLDEKLNGGWFVGSKERDYVKECSLIITKIAKLIDVHHPVVFFGASAGGFSSLMLASCIPGSRAVVDIPQVDLFTYHVKNEVDKLILSALSFNDLSSVTDDFYFRLRVIDRFKKEGRVPDIVYMHNVKDSAHFTQFSSFLSEWTKLAHELNQKDVGFLKIITYSRWHISKGGHFPMEKHNAVKQLLSVL
ncbi:hypothetical protein CK497_07770 [Vreelandella alkaliphila]|uniref:Uncharacterized protein n=2 Tax=Vreelandella alkaliphila TaxID=272774 RepID=A0ABX4HKK3_9GAMM|nr:hypothetical protein CK497_07770 [Halomonas humidisoli]